MKKILELTTEIEHLLIACFDSHLKTQGYAAHSEISKILAAVRLIEDPKPEKNE